MNMNLTKDIIHVISQFLTLHDVYVVTRSINKYFENVIKTFMHNYCTLKIGQKNINLILLCQSTHTKTFRLPKNIVFIDKIFFGNELKIFDELSNRRIKFYRCNVWDTMRLPQSIQSLEVRKTTIVKLGDVLAKTAMDELSINTIVTGYTGAPIIGSCMDYFDQIICNLDLKVLDLECGNYVKPTITSEHLNKLLKIGSGSRLHTLKLH